MQHRSCPSRAQRPEPGRLRTPGSDRDGRLHALSDPRQRPLPVSNTSGVGQLRTCPGRLSSRCKGCLSPSAAGRLWLSGSWMGHAGRARRFVFACRFTAARDSETQVLSAPTGQLPSKAVGQICLAALERDRSVRVRGDRVVTHSPSPGCVQRHGSGGFVLKVPVGSPSGTLRGTLRAAYLRGSSFS
jgi:hypothetical protein